MSSSFKAVGSQIIVKLVKPKSTIDLSAASSVIANRETKGIVESIGTKCSLGVRPGHEVMFKAGTKPVCIESNDDYDLLLVPEVSVAYVSNWTEKDEESV